MKTLLLALAFAAGVAHAASAAAVGRRAQSDGPLDTGQREDSSIHYVDFERAPSTPDEVITLYCDTWDLTHSLNWRESAEPKESP